MCGAQGEICIVNTFFFNPLACCFLYQVKDLSAPSYIDIAGTLKIEAHVVSKCLYLFTRRIYTVSSSNSNNVIVSVGNSVISDNVKEGKRD